MPAAPGPGTAYVGGFATERQAVRRIERKCADSEQHRFTASSGHCINPLAQVLSWHKPKEKVENGRCISAKNRGIGCRLPASLLQTVATRLTTLIIYELLRGC